MKRIAVQKVNPQGKKSSRILVEGVDGGRERKKEKEEGRRKITNKR